MTWAVQIRLAWTPVNWEKIKWLHWNWRHWIKKRKKKKKKKRITIPHTNHEFEFAGPRCVWHELIQINHIWLLATTTISTICATPNKAFLIYIAVDWRICSNQSTFNTLFVLNDYFISCLSFFVCNAQIVDRLRLFFHIARKFIMNENWNTVTQQNTNHIHNRW